MLDTHYAPQKLLLVGDIYELYHSTLGKKALISFSHAYNDLGFEEHIVLSEKKDFKEAAANLFSALRQLDKSDVDIILAEHFPEEGLGKAINDRLKRASAKR
jgi:L-threonylcarbamoyladenylate synthase